MTASRAFCPAHITGLFSIHDAPADVLERGSRGAGLSLDAGVRAAVSVTRGDGVATRFNGREAEAPTTASAVARLLRGERRRVEVDHAFTLPVSQGLGLSGAGSLAAALALARLLGRDAQEALEAAHAAEVENRTGLGDVAAQWTGGLEIRVKAGCPPRGEVRRLPRPHEEMAVLVCVVGGPLETRSVLSSPEARGRVNAIGDRLVDELLAFPTVGRLMEVSRRFALESGLADAAIREALEAVQHMAPASQSMLGRSIFAVTTPERAARVEETLRRHGQVHRCAVSWTGPRVEQSTSPASP